MLAFVFNDPDKLDFDWFGYTPPTVPLDGSRALVLYELDGEECIPGVHRLDGVILDEEGA
jgi:hypothetical protein